MQDVALSPADVRKRHPRHVFITDCDSIVPDSVEDGLKKLGGEKVDRHGEEWGM